jgi:gelsolin
LISLGSDLGSSPVQHREVQHQESALFQSYFPRLIYLSGGVSSGFHHHDEQKPVTRLLQVHKPHALSATHTRNAVIITEVPLHSDSLNSGDVFVLDTGDKIYQWHGQESQGVEKAKAAEFIAQLISERDGKGETIIVGK